MRENIHPKYVTATVKCACGNTFETMSLTEEIKWPSAPTATRSSRASRS